MRIGVQEEMNVEDGRGNEGGRERGGRLKGVRKRKRAYRGFECDVAAWRVRLAKIKEESDR